MGGCGSEAIGGLGPCSDTPSHGQRFSLFVYLEDGGQPCVAGAREVCQVGHLLDRAEDRFRPMERIPAIMLFGRVRTVQADGSVRS